MRGLLRAEGIKVTGRKLVWVLAGIVVVLSAIGAFFQFAAADLIDVPDLQLLEVPRKPEAFLYGFSNAAGSSWLPVILGAVLLGTEFGKGTWAISLTWESRRWRHLLAKLVALSTAATALALVGVVIWAVFAAGLAEGDGAPSLFELIGAATKLAYIEVVWVAFGLAAAALVRSTGLAVGLALGFTFVEQLLFILPSYQRLSISGATTGIFGLELPAIVGQPLAVPGVGASVLILAGWGVVSGFAAWAALTYRDA
ncbi:MAG TPA: hypothetical protein VIL12_01840 [Acidimicrobiia bacterium]